MLIFTLFFGLIFYSFYTKNLIIKERDALYLDAAITLKAEITSLAVKDLMHSVSPNVLSESTLALNDSVIYYRLISLKSVEYLNLAPNITRKITQYAVEEIDTYYTSMDLPQLTIVRRIEKNISKIVEEVVINLESADSILRLKKPFEEHTAPYLFWSFMIFSHLVFSLKTPKSASDDVLKDSNASAQKNTHNPKQKA